MLRFPLLVLLICHSQALVSNSKTSTKTGTATPASQTQTPSTSPLPTLSPEIWGLYDMSVVSPTLQQVTLYRSSIDNGLYTQLSNVASPTAPSNAQDIWLAWQNGQAYPNVATQGSKDPAGDLLANVDVVSYWKYLRLNITDAGDVGVDLFSPLLATSYSRGNIQSWGVFTDVGFAPYATAAACIGAIDAGFANVDLTGTPYKLILADFSTYGINVVGGVEIVSNQVVNLHAGGACGFAGPINSTMYAATPVSNDPPSKRLMRLNARIIPWPSNTPTPSGTPSNTPSMTASPSVTPPPIGSSYPTHTPSKSPTPSATPSQTTTAAVTSSQTLTPAESTTATSTQSASQTSSSTQSASLTTSSTAEATASATAAASSSIVASPSITRSSTKTRTTTPSRTAVSTVTRTTTGSQSASAASTTTSSVTPSFTVTPTGSASVSETASATPSSSSSATSSITSSASLTAAASSTPSMSATWTPGLTSLTATRSPAPTSTPSASLAVTTPDTVIAILSLPGCNATGLQLDGPTGFAIRAALASAAGLPLSTATVIGARCSDDPHGAHYVSFGVGDPVNAYNGNATLTSDVTNSSSVSRRLQSIATVVAGLSLLIDTRVSPIPPSPADLGQSSTGLPALSTLTADLNVQARIEALAGSVGPEYTAAAASAGLGVITINSTAVAANFAAVATAWGAIVGNATVASGTVGVASVAYSTPSGSTPPYLWWLPLPITFGALLAGFLVASYVVVTNGAAAAAAGGGQGVGAGVIAAVVSCMWWSQPAATPPSAA